MRTPHPTRHRHRSPRSERDNRSTPSNGAAIGSTCAAPTVGWVVWTAAVFTRPINLGTFAFAGAALAVISVFLPWFTSGDIRISAWKTPLHYLVSGGGDGTGFKAGIPLLLPGLAAIVVLARVAVPRW